MPVQELSKKNFEEVTKKEKSIVIDFHAISWCYPCKQLFPIFEDLSNELAIDFYEINIDKEPELTQQFSIMSVPTILILKQGQEILRINGVLPKEQLKNKILSKI